MRSLWPANREQRKLLASLAANFLTRIPGAVGLLWFLPLLVSGLGTEKYGDLLAAMALSGATGGFLSGGVKTIGRRWIGEAYGANDRVGEANAFASLIVSNLILMALAIMIISVYVVSCGNALEVWIVAIICVFSICCNTFNDARAAYNEHYVTATLLFGLQIAVYTIAAFVPSTQQNLVLGVLIFQGPYLLSSLITGVMLLRERPYLMFGRPVTLWRMVCDGTRLSMADSFLEVPLSLTVVWLQASADATTSAWFATVVRLFQTFQAPILLVLMPLSGYVRLLWNRKTASQRQLFVKVLLVASFSYALVVAVALLLSSQFYIGLMLHIPAPPIWQNLPIFLLLGMIIAYKTYSMIVYVVLDSNHLAGWITVTTGVTAAILGAAATLGDPLIILDIYALITGTAIIWVMTWSMVRFVRLPATS